MPLRDTKVFFTKVTYARVNANASGRNCVYVTEAPLAKVSNSLQGNSQIAELLV